MTLIELCIVLVVLGVLAAIALPHFLRVRERAYLAAMESDLRSMASGQELYQDAHQEYASSTGLLPDFRSTVGVTVSITAAGKTGWAATAVHRSLARRCGLYYGSANAADAPPAMIPGVVGCD